jgi:hypothetical protein
MRFQYCASVNPAWIFAKACIKFRQFLVLTVAELPRFERPYFDWPLKKCRYFEVNFVS